MDASVEYFLGLLKTDQLDVFLIIGVKLVHVTIQILNLELKAMIGLQVITAFQFTGRETYSGIDQPLENVIFDYTKPNVKENLIRKQFCERQ